VFNRYTVAFEEENVTCVNTSANGMLLELPRQAKRGDMLELRWSATLPASITIVEVCWAKSVRRSGRISYRVGRRRVFSTETADPVLGPPNRQSSS